MSAPEDLDSDASPATLPSRPGPVPPLLAVESADFVHAEDDEEDEEVLEVEPEPAGEEDLAAYRAAAPSRYGRLHESLRIENLSRTTAVFLVGSGERSGYLHLVDGELVHAETGRLSGEAAAVEILSWRDSALEDCGRTLAPVRTVHSSLQSLLAKAAQGTAEAPLARPHQSSRVVRRPLDQDAPTETYLPPISASGGLEREAGVATKAVAAAGPRSVLPPPLPLPEPEPSSVADVRISASGEVIQGRGAGAEELAARVAYAARLAELIGRAIRSGTPRGLELRGKSTQTLVRWQGDGTLSASLDLPQPSRR